MDALNKALDSNEVKAAKYAYAALKKTASQHPNNGAGRPQGPPPREHLLVELEIQPAPVQVQTNFTTSGTPKLRASARGRSSRTNPCPRWLHAITGRTGWTTASGRRRRCGLLLILEFGLPNRRCWRLRPRDSRGRNCAGTVQPIVSPTTIKPTRKSSHDLTDLVLSRQKWRERRD